MENQSFYTRQMLLQYGKQLIAARRLMRYEQLSGQAHAEPAHVVMAQRAYMVERITREIVENLIFSGSNNAIVLQAQQKLAEKFGHPFVFRYPPGEMDFEIFRVTPEKNEEKLSADEKKAVMGELWDITRKLVDNTMI